MGNGGNVLNEGNFYTAYAERADSRFSALSRPLNEYFDRTKTVFHSRSRRLLASLLSSKRSGLSRTAETERAGGAMGNRVAVYVGDSDNRAIDRRFDMDLTFVNLLKFSTSF